MVCLYECINLLSLHSSIEIIIYTHPLFPYPPQDYPSVAQIYTSMVRHDIVPIFACTTDFLHLYQNLTLVLPGASAVELNNDSSNIIDIISEEYAVCSVEDVVHVSNI